MPLNKFHPSDPGFFSCYPGLHLQLCEAYDHHCFRRSVEPFSHTTSEVRPLVGQFLLFHTFFGSIPPPLFPPFRAILNLCLLSLPALSSNQSFLPECSRRFPFFRKRSGTDAWGSPLLFYPRLTRIPGPVAPNVPFHVRFLFVSANVSPKISLRFFFLEESHLFPSFPHA